MNGADPITIIAAGGLGFIKELYEPLFAEILDLTQSSGVQIRSIWIADMFNIGESAVINRDNLGCDPAWVDHSRDLFSIINHFHREMPKPIIGLGHSFGCNQIACLSSWHPTLFHSLAFIEPGIDPQYGRGISVKWSFQTLRQNDAWATREEAEDGLVKSHGAKSWDDKIIARLKCYGIYEKRTEGRTIWAFTTPKDQIAGLVSRLNSKKIGLGSGGIEDVSLEERELIPDSDPDGFNHGPFYRPELRLAWNMLPAVRPWVLYINGGRSPFFGHAETREKRVHLTGTGVGGNGGLRLGAVKQIVIEDAEHTMVFDRNFKIVARHVSEWMMAERDRWTNGPKKRREIWLARSLMEKQTVGPEYIAALEAEMKRPKRIEKI